MVQIERPDQLEEWLQDQPPKVGQVIAARSALRILPLVLVYAEHSAAKDLDLAVLRASALSWAACNYPAHDMSVSAHAAADAADRAARDAAARPAARPVARAVGDAAARAAFAAARAARAAAHDAVDDAVDAARHAIGAAIDNPVGDASDIWGGVKRDAEWLKAHIDPKDAARVLTGRSLWLSHTPDWWPGVWNEGAKRLLQTDPFFQVWIDWYDRRISGKSSAFDIPHDIGRTEDKDILRRLADASDEDLWNNGAQYVSAALTDWVNLARERTTYRHSKEQADLEEMGRISEELLETADKEKTKARLQSSASPKFRETEGQLDAVANAKFDKPTYSGDLADLPATLQSFTRSLAQSLGRNASEFMRTSLTEYENELRVRGPRPILGLLKGQASGIASEVYTKRSLAASDDPAEWEMIDEREWGPGAARLFQTFFTYHDELIKHFPLDEEREELLRETPINDQAATGEALTSPMEVMAKLVRDLHAQGIATDDIVKIVDALEEHTAHVAALPTPPPDLPDDYISPQKRVALNNAGLLFDLHAFLGSTASMASWLQQNPTAVAQIHAAALAMLALVG